MIRIIVQCTFNFIMTCYKLRKLNSIVIKDRSINIYYFEFFHFGVRRSKLIFLDVL